MKFRVALFVISLACFTPAANAAIRVTPAKAPITAISPAGSGDQISDFTVNPTVIAIVGTIESGLTNLVTAPSLGGSDGFITALDKSKVRLWDLRLGSSSDDIATAITKDKSGYFWIVGATSKPIETTTSIIDTATLNLDSVVVDPVTTPINSLNRLVIWKVGVTGQLAETYYFDVDGMVAPSVINFDGTNFKVTGNITKDLVTQQFSISLDQSGSFSELTLGKIAAVKPPAIATIKAGVNNLKSFISKTTIIGIPSWRAKSPTPVIVKYTKAGKVLAANSFTGKVKKVLWQSGIGAVVLVETNLDNEIHVLPNMA
ncbi:unannotated protein [freshwater metagenome]|uniref:Unannotated protein n=1 Tax=freshwater metagenome TaxID=449393 RepID=A0A6J6U385_9ZZZZ|nr:hypothetical protein [Actinomycetota bacterium]